MRNGYLKLANVTPKVYLGDMDANISEMKKTLKKIDADIVTFPELSVIHLAIYSIQMISLTK